MNIILLLVIIFIPLLSLIGLMILIKKKLKQLENKFGGKVTSNIFGADYLLDDMELKYNLGSQYALGSTEIKVKNKPKKTINIILEPKLFSKRGIKFEELYEYRCISQDNFDILTNDMKQFLVDSEQYFIRLMVNNNEFWFKTRLSPIYINEIVQCMEFLLLIRKRIKEHDLIDSGNHQI